MAKSKPVKQKTNQSVILPLTSQALHQLNNLKLSFLHANYSLMLLDQSSFNVRLVSRFKVEVMHSLSLYFHLRRLSAKKTLEWLFWTTHIHLAYRINCSKPSSLANWLREPQILPILSLSHSLSRYRYSNV